MKPNCVLLLIALLLTIPGGHAKALGGNFLNVAILELPERYFGDCPLKKRTLALEILSSSDGPLDYEHGWLYWSMDGANAEGGPLASELHIKLLPRKDDTPLVFVHMGGAFLWGCTPRSNKTFVLERDGNEWRDVTKTVMPKQVDLTMHLSPRRLTNVIEVAPYERFKRQDGRGYAYKCGHRKLDLVWNGESFEIRKPENVELSKD